MTIETEATRPFGVRSRRRSAWWGVALLMCACSVLVLWAGRGVAPFGDQWAWIFGALHLDADTVLQDYNGHLLATTYLTYAGLLATFGLPAYWVYPSTMLLLHLAVVVAVFLLARRRLGAWPAVVPAAAVALLGTGSDVFLNGNVGIGMATAACAGALVALDRHTRAGDVAACALLLVGVASFSSAFVHTAGVWVEILRQGDRWRRMWVPLLPTVAYATWRLTSGTLTGDTSSAGSDSGVFGVVVHAVEVAAGAVAGLGGVQLASPTVEDHLPWLHSLLAVVTAAMVVAAVVLVARRHVLTPRLANVALTAAGLCLLIALGRGSNTDPYASRYVYLVAVVLVLIAVELGAVLDFRSIPVRIALVVVTTSIALNVVWLLVWADHVRGESAATRAELTALDLAGAQSTPDFRPSSDFRLLAVTAGEYREVVRRFGGSPALTPAELRRAPERYRESADEIMVRALALAPDPGAAPTGGARPVVDDASAARIAGAGSCLTVTPEAATARTDITVPPSGVVVTPHNGGGVLIQARRFGDRFRAGVGGATGPATLAAPRGQAPDLWHLRLVANAPTTICTRAR